jgi:mono/diheme cytochrome c family protein
MNKRRVIFFGSLSALLALTSVVFGGGWAIITLDDFPDFAIAGRPLNLTFTVRQHGVTPIDGLKPTLRATTTTGREVKVGAAAGKSRGEYTAALTLPQPGEWTISIANAFNAVETTFPTMKVVASVAPPPAAYAPATRGHRLFTAKGCIGCHRHIEVNPGFQTDSRLDLTARRFNHDYLLGFLADPSIKTQDMPNLKLSKNEIEALAAFINKGALKKDFDKERVTR